MGLPQWDDRILELPGEGGLVTVRFFGAADALGAAVLFGGIGGGFDSPAAGLYPWLAAELPEQQVAVLRVCYRRPTHLGDSVEDVRAGISWLRRHGLKRVVLVGHSFGGAVAIKTALDEPSVAAVITLATQGVGTEGVSHLRRPLLLIHGTADRILAPACSERLYARAGSGAELRLYEGATHGLNESAHEIRELVVPWIVARLRQVPQSGR